MSETHDPLWFIVRYYTNTKKHLPDKITNYPFITTVPNKQFGKDRKQTKINKEISCIESVYERKWTFTFLLTCPRFWDFTFLIAVFMINNCSASKE